MPPIWIDAQVTRIENATSRVRRIWLALPDQTEFYFRAGQFITLDLPIGEKRLQRWRSYSLADAPGKGELELCIVHMPGGQASSFLCQDLQVGDTLRFKGPDGSFLLPDPLDCDLVMICTGTGIAPFRSMLLDLERKGWTERQIHLVYGSRTRYDLLYKDEFLEMATRHPNFQYSVALSRIEDGPDEPWITKGYVHDVYMNRYATPEPDRKFLLCGWTNMIDDAVVQLIVKAGYKKEQVSYELYG
ncbi:MAG: hypothetical protein KA479_03085 [Saprospiraceae bacterium]|nr:hypothetical protein [Saprospiraceae bacterium]